MARWRVHLLLQPYQHERVAVAGAALLGGIAVERRPGLASGEQVEVVRRLVGRQPSAAASAVYGGADDGHRAHEQGFEAILVRPNLARTESPPFYERLGYRRGKTRRAGAKRWGAPT